MQQIIDIIWRIDYPLTLLISFIIFAIPLKKRKYFWISILVGTAVLFSAWLLRSIPVFDSNEFLVFPLYLIEIAILFGIIYFTLDLNIIEALFILVCALSVQHLAYKVSLGVMNFVDINLFNTPWYFLFSYVSLGIISVIVYYIFSRKLIDYIGHSSFLMNMIVLTLVVVMDIFFSIAEQKVMFADIPNRLLISSLINFSNIISTILIIVFLYTFAISLKRKEDNITTALIKTKEYERYEKSKIMNEEINIKYHDLKKMLQNNELSEGARKDIEETITNYKAFVNTSNSGLNVIIYETQLRCIKEGIDLNVLIDGDYFASFKENHIYSLFSNILDNAIEATMDLPKEDKRIHLTIKKVRESIVIVCENPTKNSLKINNGFPLTSKKDKANHGFGFRSIKRITDIYKGVLSYEIKNNVFTLKIVFPL